MKKRNIRIQVEKNRIIKIARNKKKRKHKKYDPNRKYKINLPTSKKNSIKLPKVLNVLAENDFLSKPTIKNKIINIHIPREFCLIRNSNTSLQVLKEINYCFTMTSIEEIFFDYSDCEVLGLDASVITDVIVLEGLKYREKLKIPYKLNGNFPKTPEAIQVFINSGLLKHLEISKNVSDPLVERLDPFTKNNSSLELTNNVIKYYQNCLRRNGYELTSKGIDKFNNLVGEITDNMTIHCGDNGSWFVSGHFAQEKNQNIGKGTLTFINFGNSIYESLKDSSTSDRIKRKLNQRTKQQKPLFEFGIWNEESSWTVFALQYKISRLNNPKDKDRGTGTIKFIKNFSILGKSIQNDKPLMAILSGNTHILFNGKYKIINKIIRGNEVPVIAFNKENDISKRPDKDVVKINDNKFPGTVITTEFYVDSKYLKLIKEGDNVEQ